MKLPLILAIAFTPILAAAGSRFTVKKPAPAPVAPVVKSVAEIPSSAYVMASPNFAGYTIIGATDANGGSWYTIYDGTTVFAKEISLAQVKVDAGM
jgi:hypothetical protein